jgi:ribosome recycling factor
MIGVRNIRHEAIRRAEQAERDKQISKDERFNFEKQIDEMLAKQKTEIDVLAKTKESEILSL